MRSNQIANFVGASLRVRGPGRPFHDPGKAIGSHWSFLCARESDRWGQNSERRMGSTSSHDTMPQQSVHEFTVQDASGGSVDLSSYKGKVLLIVNVASQCGFTQTNYKELTELHNKYRDKDFEVLAFPCNQFGGQEPGSNEQIKDFACTRFKSEFHIFDKVNVNGADTSPLYKFLKAKKGGVLGSSIKWNFSKFLIDKEGNVVERYAPNKNPSKIEKDIQKLL